MHPAIRADQNLRALALSETRNVLGANVPRSEFLLAEGISDAEYAGISKNPEYQRFLREYKADLTANGFSFAAKARVLAEDLLADVYLMAKDSDTPAAMRVKTLENLVDWGRLVPKADPTAAGAGFSVTINLGGALPAVTLTSAPPPADVIDVTPIPAMNKPLAAPLSVEEAMYYEAEASSCA